MIEFCIIDAVNYGLIPPNSARVYHYQGGKSLLRKVDGVNTTFFKFVNGEYSIYVSEAGRGLNPNYGGAKFKVAYPTVINKPEDIDMPKIVSCLCIGGPKHGTYAATTDDQLYLRFENIDAPLFYSASNPFEKPKTNTVIYAAHKFKLDHVDHKVFIHTELETSKGVLKFLAEYVKPNHRQGDLVWYITETKDSSPVQLTQYIVKGVEIGVRDTGQAFYAYKIRPVNVGPRSSELVVSSNSVYENLERVPTALK